jgi:hypothetical protein
VVTFSTLPAAAGRGPESVPSINVPVRRDVPARKREDAEHSQASIHRRSWMPTLWPFADASLPHVPLLIRPRDDRPYSRFPRGNRIQQLKECGYCFTGETYRLPTLLVGASAFRSGRVQAGLQHG